MKKFLDIISSKKFRNTFAFVMFAVLMTACISSQNFFFQRVIENNIALKDVIAERDIKVIDTVKTEQHFRIAVSMRDVRTDLCFLLRRRQMSSGRNLLQM